MAVVLALGIAWPAAAARADDEPDLAGYRERFKEGLDRYESGDVAGALSFWEPLYRDLGPVRGYRIGYNLARAYEVVGDATRAAERYESFLAELATKQKAGEAVGVTVTHDAAQAQGRLDELAKTRGRIRVASATPPVSVRIDEAEPRLSGFVAYVAPGPHDVVFAPGTTDEHRERVQVGAGEVIDTTAPVAPPMTSPPRGAHSQASSLLLAGHGPPQWGEVVVHPFGPGWLWVAGAVTLASGALTGGAYANAAAIHDRYAPPYPTSQADVDRYNDARNLAYASWALPATFAVTTAALVAWYVLGKRIVHVPVGVLRAGCGWSF